MQFLEFISPMFTTLLGAWLVWFWAPRVEERKLNNSKKIAKDLMYEEIGEVEFFFNGAFEKVCDFHEISILARCRLGSRSVLESFSWPVEYETKFLSDRFQECYGFLSSQERRTLRAIISCIADYNKKIGKMDHDKSIYDLCHDYPSISLVYTMCSIIFLSEKIKNERERYQGCAGVDVNDSVLRAYGRTVDENLIKSSSKFLS